ncbi:MAG: TolC family protein [Sphingorhabdus sp.]
MQRKKRIAVLLALASGAASGFVLPANPALAQLTSLNNTPSSTMATLARKVVESNPDIAAQRHQVRIAKARLETAEAGFLPTIEANGQVQKREIDVKKGGNGDSKFIAGQVAVEARLRVYDGDRTFNAVEVAKAELASAEAILAATISDKLLQLLTSAADVHLGRKIREYSQMQSDAIGEQVRATSRRLEFGESTLTDESLGKARLATSQAGILAATEELNVSSYNFRAVSGQSATAVPPLSGLAPVPDSLIKAQNQAIATSPRLLAAQLNTEASKASVDFAEGSLLPQLDAVGGYEYLTGGVSNLFTGKLPNDRSAVYGGIELRVPVFQPRDHAEIRRTRAVRDQRLSQIEVAERTVTEEVAISWTRWQSAKSTILAAEMAVAEIEKAAEGIKKESVGGNRTLADVLDAQNELLSARVTLERAIRNEFVARAGLLAATGGLTPESVLAGGSYSKASVSSRPEISSLGRRAEQAPPSATATPLQPGTSIIDAALDDNASPKARDPNRPEASSLGRKSSLPARDAAPISGQKR